VEVERSILRYMVSHRLAKDTVQGIVQWWLRDLTPLPSVAEVQKALEALVQKGWVVETRTSSEPALNTEGLRDSVRRQPLYGLREARLAEVEEFLGH